MSVRMTTRIAVSVAALVVAATSEVGAQSNVPGQRYEPGQWGRSVVPGGYIEWRFVERPRRFYRSDRGWQRPYRRPYQSDRYFTGRAQPYAVPPAGTPRDERPWRYRYDERRGVWIAERFT